MELVIESKSKQAKKVSFLFPCPLYRLPTEGVLQIKDASSHLKSCGLKLYIPMSNDWIKKKNPSQVLPNHLGFS